MQVQVSQNDFIAKLNEAIRFIAGKTSTPLLSGFYLETLESKTHGKNTPAALQIRSSTGSVIYQTALPCQIKEPGSLVVPAALLLSILKSLESSPVELTTQGDLLVLTQGKSRSEIATLPADGFPAIKTFEKPQPFRLPIAEFVRDGKKVLIAASADETKPVLTALALETAQPNALVCTDGFRLFRLQTDLSLDQKGMFLLPSKVIKDLFGILEKVEDSTLSCTTDEKRQEIIFQFGGASETDTDFSEKGTKSSDTLPFSTTLQISAIQGEFPPYQSIIPENCAFSITVDRELLQQKVNQAMIFAREFSSIVVFWVEENELVIASQANVRGKTESRLPLLATEGQPVKFACNGKYVLDFLSSVESDAILIQGNESLKPVLLRVPEDTAYLYLIMPFKLSE